MLYDWGDYKVYEQIDARAFDDCDMNDVIMQYDHCGRVFARTSNETLQLRTDSHGLYIEADLGGTEAGRALYEEIKGGYTNKMSFGFRVQEDKREDIEDHDLGIIKISISTNTLKTTQTCDLGIFKISTSTNVLKTS